MKFKIATDYAIRILCYLCEKNNRLSTAVELSENLGITYLYFMKITGKLRKENLLQSVQGCNGGYQIARSPKKIKIYDVVKVMEGEVKVNRCTEEDQFCSMGASKTCNAHEYFFQFQEMIINYLESKTIYDLCQEKSK